MVGIRAEICVVVPVYREFRCIHYVKPARQLGETHIGLESYVGLAIGPEPFLRGDEDDSVRSP